MARGVRKNPNSLRARIARAAEVHPNSTADELSRITGIDRERIASIAPRYGISFRRLTPEEFAEAHRGKGSSRKFEGAR